MAWNIDSLTYSAFLSGAPEKTANDLLSSVGASMRGYQQMGMASTANGTLGTLFLTATLQTGVPMLRFDAAVEMEMSQAPNKSSTIVDLSSVLVAAHSPILRMIEGLAPTPGVNRLAVAVAASEQTADVPSALGLMKAIVDVPVPVNCNETSFHTNSRTTSTSSSSLQINRLGRWTVGRAAMLNMPMFGGAPSLGSVTQFSLAVDVNTVPSAAPLDPAHLGSLLKELSDHVSGIVRDGYAYF